MRIKSCLRSLEMTEKGCLLYVRLNAFGNVSDVTPVGFKGVV